VTRGNPQAIAMVLGNAKDRGLSLANTLEGLYDTGDLLDHLFMRSWEILAENAGACHVLLAMSFFSASVSAPALNAVAHLENAAFERAVTRLRELSLLEVFYSDELSTRYSLHPLTRAFVEARLAELPGWEQEARRRWLNWWLAFTLAHGGPDEEEWAQEYDLIAAEWDNLLLVFEYCKAHGLYKTMREFWSPARLLGVTSLYGYWQERIEWLRWLRQEAEKREDWGVTVEAIAEEGFTLVQCGQRDEAGAIFDLAWERRHSASAGAQLTLVENIVQRYIKICDFAKVDEWLKKARLLLKMLYLSRHEYTRHELTLEYFAGILFIARHNHTCAENCFQHAFKEAQRIRWLRGMVYVQQYLGDIACARGQYAQAEDLLKSGLAIVERNRDWRRAAYYKRSLAHLALKRDRRRKPGEVIHWAQLALNDFARLGMQEEVQKLQRLLRHMQSLAARPAPLLAPPLPRFAREACSTMGDLSSCAG